jgi:hypothetical protein
LGGAERYFTHKFVSAKWATEMIGYNIFHNFLVGVKRQYK